MKFIPENRFQNWRKKHPSFFSVREFTFCLMRTCWFYFVLLVMFLAKLPMNASKFPAILWIIHFHCIFPSFCYSRLVCCLVSFLFTIMTVFFSLRCPIDSALVSDYYHPKLRFFLYCCFHSLIITFVGLKRFFFKEFLRSWFNDFHYN